MAWTRATPQHLSSWSAFLFATAKDLIRIHGTNGKIIHTRYPQKKKIVFFIFSCSSFFFFFVGNTNESE
jgi:hypothetical protein